MKVANRLVATASIIERYHGHLLRSVPQEIGLLFTPVPAPYFVTGSTLNRMGRKVSLYFASKLGCADGTGPAVGAALADLFEKACPIAAV